MQTNNDWTEIQTWRRATRVRLLKARRAMSARQRKRIKTEMSRHLLEAIVPIPGDCIGFYWPIKGEIDLRQAVAGFMTQGASAALPVVVARSAPLEFSPWRPGAAMVRGLWNIPVPAVATRVQPSLLLIPLVGFDDQGYRLGYGGGYYDRTLAAMPKRLCIGLGFAASKVPTIHPQPHDHAMDAILTEAGWHIPLPITERRVRKLNRE